MAATAKQLISAARAEGVTAVTEKIRIALVDQVKAWIGEHYLENPGLPEIAQAAGYSPCHFHRMFTKHAGVNPKDYVDSLRIAKAQELIRAGKLSLPEIASKLKFAHHSHFTSRFKQIAGLPPARWVKEHRAAAAK